jgi:trk system potassium uptake protein
VLSGRRSASPTSRSARQSALLHPARLTVLAFTLAALIGSLLLALPVATESGHAVPYTTALFTSVSAISVTGLTVVDTSGHWSAFGEVVILLLIQLGGFGIMTLASLLGVVVFRRLGLRNRLSAQVELSDLGIGGVGALVRKIGLFYLVVEGGGVILLTLVALTSTDLGFGSALWFGLFHSVSAFNNAGFSTFSDNLVGFSSNPAVLGTIGFLIVAGGIGFPVVLDVVRRGSRWRRWSLHSRLTLSTTAVLLVGGTALIGMFEWTNPDTLGAMSVVDRFTNATFASVTPRTAGFNSLNYDQVHASTLLVTQALMLIGGASGSTAGGIKVTTFALLGFVIWAELRGEHDVQIFGWRIEERAQRQAVSIALVGVGLAMGGSIALATLTDYPIGTVTFEVLSAVNTVGLSTGITTELAPGAQLLLSALMLLGRLGPVTVGTALVLRSRQTLYRYPEGRPLLG